MTTEETPRMERVYGRKWSMKAERPTKREKTEEAEDKLGKWSHPAS
jgi:hypothetical protein